MRFAFGKNWRSFLSLLDEHRVDQSRRAICDLLDRENLRDWRVLDIGSGSGLSSLAMHQLGAEVVSFDYDPDSVACTEELRRLYGASDKRWTVTQGSVLDAPFMQSLGKFNLVYSWGVLHHTGAMWQALDLAQQCVAPGGTLLIALYNDQGTCSRIGTASSAAIAAVPLDAGWSVPHSFHCSGCTAWRWTAVITNFPAAISALMRKSVACR